MASLNQELIFRLTSDGKVYDKNKAIIDCKCTGEKIIRCKDCRYFDPFLSDTGGSGSCDRNVDYWDEAGESFPVSKNDYCSLGSAKEDE